MKHRNLVASVLARRMKDYYDLWMLSRDETVDANMASRAIGRTFRRRKTGLPNHVPDGLLDEFAQNEFKIVQWNAFVRKNRISLANNDFLSIVRDVRKFLMELVPLDREGDTYAEQNSAELAEWCAK